MRKKVTTETVTCDLCGDNMEKVEIDTYRPIRAINVSIEVYYGGTFKAEDICKTCGERLHSFLVDNSMTRFMTRGR